MKKYSNLIIILFTSYILILVFLKKELISNTILLSLYLWYNTLIPSMLPMFILSDILINYHFTDYIPSKIINFISKLFNISKNGVLLFFLSLISGFPLNAINIKKAYDKKMITKEEGEHLLLFNHFSNPLFILETVGVFYLKNNKLGIIILISHIMSNVIIGIIFRNKNYSSKVNYISKEKECQSFGDVLSNSISKSINSLLLIGGTVTIFLVLSTLINNVFNLNCYMEAIVKGIMEMTMGLSNISKLDISIISKAILSTMIISFGGLSIHMQVYSSLGEIKYKNYFIGRIYQVIISGVICYIILMIN